MMNKNLSDHNFVLSDQDGVLVGHMSFQVKKLFAALHVENKWRFLKFLALSDHQTMPVET